MKGGWAGRDLYPLSIVHRNSSATSNKKEHFFFDVGLDRIRILNERHKCDTDKAHFLLQILALFALIEF